MHALSCAYSRFSTVVSVTADELEAELETGVGGSWQIGGATDVAPGDQRDDSAVHHEPGLGSVFFVLYL